jgi:hypothetical protein
MRLASAYRGLLSRVFEHGLLRIVLWSGACLSWEAFDDALYRLWPLRNYCCARLLRRLLEFPQFLSTSLSRVKSPASGCH